MTTDTNDVGMEKDWQWMEKIESMSQQQQQQQQQQQEEEQEDEDDQQYRIQHHDRKETKPMRDLTDHPDEELVPDDENDEEVDDVITSVSSSFPNEKKKKNAKKKRHGARNQHKMKYFVQWIHETFLNHNTNIAATTTTKTTSQQDQLESISSLKLQTVLESSQPYSPPPPSSYHYVLDVAGGKGELAARLIMCCPNIHVTLVDPRNADIATVYQNWIVPKLPKKWQQQYYSKLHMNDNFMNDILTERYVQLQMYFTTETIQNHNSNSSSSSNDETSSLQNAIEQCTLMIGMHADSATECIVDMALQYQKPFVVVPCCVFPNLFPQRYVTVQSNETKTTKTTKVPVRTYEQFCDYLHQKDVRFQRTVLPFDGRNIAIWWDGK